MTTRQLNVVADGLHYLEAPRWHDGKLWFVDFYTKAVYSLDNDGKANEVIKIKEQPSGLGWLPNGRMLIVSMKDRKVLRLEANGELVQHADLWDLCEGHANDMVVAPNGNAYVGNFGYDLMGGADHKDTGIVLVKPDGSTQKVAEGLSFPNGMVITPDEKTLIVNELFGNRISKFAINDDGTLGERHDFASFGSLGDEPSVARRMEKATIKPDGLALDAEGAIWFADTVNQRAVRMAEGGEILETVDVAPELVFAVALGGDDGKTLFMCVAPDWEEANRKSENLGRMISTKVSVGHAGTP